MESQFDTTEEQPLVIQSQLQATESTSSSVATLYEGRRLVELDVIAKEAWCDSCHQKISFCYMVEEMIQGIVSVLRLRCQRCLRIKVVHTSKTNKQYHDTNMKLAVGNEKYSEHWNNTE